MGEPLQKNPNIGDVIRSEVKNAILNKTTDGLNQFINKLGSYSQHLLFRYLIRKEFPFSPDEGSHPHLRIKFDTIKGLKILKIQNKNNSITLTKEQIPILWEKVSKQLKLNDNFFSLLKYHDIMGKHHDITDTKNIYDRINYVIKNYLNISNDSHNNYEYGPQGVPGQKRSRYKRRYHRK